MDRERVDLVEKAAAFSGYFRIDRLRLRFPLYEGGMSREVTREVLERGQVAAVLLVDPDRDAVVLIEQFRPGPYAAGEARPWLIEIGRWNHRGRRERRGDGAARVARGSRLQRSPT